MFVFVTLYLRGNPQLKTGYYSSQFGIDAEDGLCNSITDFIF